MSNNIGSRYCGSSFNYGLLIDLVKEFPAIYDCHNDMYRNRDCVQKIWRFIAQKLNSTEITCKEKWANLRSNFRREMRKVRARSLADRPKKVTWRYYDALSFLSSSTDAELDALLMRESGSSDNPLIVNVVEPIFIHDHKTAHDAKASSEAAAFLDELYKEEKFPLVESDDELVKEEFEFQEDNSATGHLRQLVDTLRQLTSNSMYDESDGDKMFALSLVPLMKKLPLDQNLKFRYDILNLLRERIKTFGHLTTGTIEINDDGVWEEDL